MSLYNSLVTLPEEANRSATDGPLAGVKDGGRDMGAELQGEASSQGFTHVGRQMEEGRRDYNIQFSEPLLNSSSKLVETNKKKISLKQEIK